MLINMFLLTLLYQIDLNNEERLGTWLPRFAPSPLRFPVQFVQQILNQTQQGMSQE